MTEAQLTAYIKETCAIKDLPWALVKAVCYVESALDPWAVRHEARYRWVVGDSAAMSATERICQMTSWGLMQVMGGVARQYGFAGYLSRLCEPGTGLHYGMQHLKQFYDKHRNWPDAIASYNAGSPKKNDAGRYYNQDYVDKVLRQWNHYEQQDHLTAEPAHGAV